MSNELIGITTYRRADMLRDCVESIRANTDMTDCFLVIHNNSTDDTYRHVVEEIAYANNAEVLSDGINHGLAAALNRVAQQHVNAARIILMNDDIKVFSGWQEAIRKTLDDPAIGLISLSLANGHAEWNHKNPEVDVANLSLARYYCTYPTGCLMAMRRDVYERVGIFDERLWLKLEEVDYGIRTMRVGYRNANIGVDGETYKFAAHYGSASGGGNPDSSDMSTDQIEIARDTVAHFERKHGTGFPLPKDFEQRLLETLPART